MSVKFDRKECGNGMSLTTIYDPKFKSFGMMIKMVLPIDKDKIPLYELALNILSTSTRKYPEKEELSKVLTELYSSSVSSNVSRAGDHYSLTLSLNCLCDKYTIDHEVISYKAVQLLLDCLLDPYLENGTLSEKYFRLCRDDMLDDIDTIINNKRRFAIMLANKIIFENEPAAVTAFDFRDAVVNATAASVTEAYYEMLKKAYIEIFVTGGECDSATVALVTDALNSLDRDPIKIDVYGRPSALKREVRRDEISFEANQSQLIMAYKTESYDEYASKLLNAMLGSTPTSKLFTNVREKLSLCYYCDAMPVDMRNTFVVSSGLDPENLTLAEEAIDAQLKAIRNGEFTDEELENSKAFLASAYLANYDSKYDIYTWFFYQIIKGTCDYPEDKGEKIRAVTREQLMKEASGYKLDTVFVLRPEEGGDNNAS